MELDERIARDVRTVRHGLGHRSVSSAGRPEHDTQEHEEESKLRLRKPKNALSVGHMSCLVLTEFGAAVILHPYTHDVDKLADHSVDRCKLLL